MSAIKPTCIVSGNLAAEPKFFPKGQYESRIIFTVIHTDRTLNQGTGQWQDGRTTSVRVSFFGSRAERLQQQVQQGFFPKGTAVVAWGSVSDTPDAYVKDGRAYASPAMTGSGIVPDQIQNRRRADRKAQQPQQPTAQGPQPDGWGTVPAPAPGQQPATGQNIQGDPWGAPGQFAQPTPPAI